MDHVATVRKTPGNDKLSLKEILKLAKKSYKKIGDNVNEKLAKSASPKKVRKSVRRSKKTYSKKVRRPLTGKKRRIKRKKTAKKRRKN